MPGVIGKTGFHNKLKKISAVFVTIHLNVR